VKKCALLLDENIKRYLILLCFTLSVHEKICVRCGNKFITYHSIHYELYFDHQYMDQIDTGPFISFGN
jgi:hypothetical protein